MLLTPAQDIQRLLAEALIFDVNTSESEIYQKLRQAVTRDNNFFLTETFQQLLAQRPRFVYETLYSKNLSLLRRCYRVGDNEYNYRQAVADLTAILPNMPEFSCAAFFNEEWTLRLNIYARCELEIPFAGEFADMVDFFDSNFTAIDAGNHSKLSSVLRNLMNSASSIITIQQCLQLITLMERFGTSEIIVSWGLFDYLTYSQVVEITAMVTWTELRDLLTSDLTKAMAVDSIVREDNLVVFKELYLADKFTGLEMSVLYRKCYIRGAYKIYSYLNNISINDYWTEENYIEMLNNYSPEIEQFLDNIVGYPGASALSLPGEQSSQVGRIKFPYSRTLFRPPEADLPNVRMRDITNFVELPPWLTFTQFLRYYHNAGTPLPLAIKSWPLLIYKGWRVVPTAFELVSLYGHEGKWDKRLANSSFLRLFDIRSFVNPAYREAFLFIYSQLRIDSNDDDSDLDTQQLILEYFHFYCLRAVKNSDLPIYPLTIYHFDRAKEMRPVPTPLARLYIFTSIYFVDGEIYHYGMMKLFYSPAYSEITISTDSKFTVWEMLTDVANWLVQHSGYEISTNEEE